MYSIVERTPVAWDGGSSQGGDILSLEARETQLSEGPRMATPLHSTKQFLQALDELQGSFCAGSES